MKLKSSKRLNCMHVCRSFSLYLMRHAIGQKILLWCKPYICWICVSMNVYVSMHVFYKSCWSNLVFLLPISILSAYILITSMCLLKFSAYILLLLITTTTQLLYSLCLCRNKIRNNILTCALQGYWSWSSTFRHETVKRYAFEHITDYLNIMILRDILNSTYIL